MMKARHIIQISSYYPPHLGGQENAVRNLATQLAPNHDHVEVLTSTRGGGPKGMRTEDRVRVRRLPSFVFGHAPIMPQFLTALLHMATAQSTVHVHIGQAFTPEMVWLASKIRGFKYVAQLHIDFEPSGPAGILLPLYKRLVLKRVLQAATAVVVLNQKTLQKIQQAYNYTGRIEVMNNGIEEAYFTVPRAPFAAQPPNTLRLLFVGRLSKQKNVTTLLKAIIASERKVHLDIVGEGDEQQAIKDMITTNELTCVTMHGRLGREEILALYASRDALIMPSLYEAQPLVLLEAMAARIPIIGTNVIGVVDHIKNAGIVIEPTVEGLVQGMERYYTDYTRLPQMVAQAYRAAEKLRWKHTLKEYEKLYEDILGN